MVLMKPRNDMYGSDAAFQLSTAGTTNVKLMPINQVNLLRRNILQSSASYSQAYKSLRM